MLRAGQLRAESPSFQKGGGGGGTNLSATVHSTGKAPPDTLVTILKRPECSGWGAEGRSTLFLAGGGGGGDDPPNHSATVYSDVRAPLDIPSNRSQAA